jgi:hypothetical protein
MTSHLWAQNLIFKNGFEAQTGFIQGAAMGLNSTGLVLELASESEQELLPVNINGPFIFTLAVPIGNHWQVEIISQPTDPSQQNCQLFNNSGEMTEAGVDNLMIICENLNSIWDEMNWSDGIWN